MPLQERAEIIAAADQVTEISGLCAEATGDAVQIAFKTGPGKIFSQGQTRFFDHQRNDPVPGFGRAFSAFQKGKSQRGEVGFILLGIERCQGPAGVITINIVAGPDRIYEFHIGEFLRVGLWFGAGQPLLFSPLHVVSQNGQKAPCQSSSQGLVGLVFPDGCKALRL